ncbi:MAG: carbohydrate ABC transporter permease [Thermomicrobiales bacterium]|nr:carbohydrate ABC transporter permease [Thermomicrobiales bacterium]
MSAITSHSATSTRQWPVRQIVVHLVLILAVAFTFAPLVWMLGLSLKAPAQIFENPLRPLTTSPTLVNYRDVASRLDVLRQLTNSVIFAGGVTLLQLLIAIPAAYAFARWKFRGNALIFSLMLLSIPIPFVVYYVPNYVLMARWDLLNTYAGMILPQAASAYAIFLLRQHFRAFPRAIIEAARLDGAGDLRLLWQVVLPNNIGAITALAIIIFIGSWNEYIWPLLIAPDKSMYTLTVAVGAMSGGEGGTRWGATMAAAVIASVFTLGAYLVSRKRLLKAMAEGGVK